MPGEYFSSGNAVAAPPKKGYADDINKEERRRGSFPPSSGFSVPRANGDECGGAATLLTFLS